ncbi:hypothetical protein [Streptomyces sp. NBC_01216]|uniref:hypothetical protein n=1 Tax=unclassified Streptomyces TaxID=2593676 RepID=UPI002E0DD35A|nr:hypothetical protein OG393_06850 [Streptomyces sp. NBC_01216]
MLEGRQDEHDRGQGMDRDATDVTEAHYELVISVDARRSGAYDDVDRPRMRERIYRILEAAFTQAKVVRDAVHMEDRGDGVLLSVAGRVAVTRLLGLWMVEVHENLRNENRTLRVPLGLRVGMHVGPVRHDERGISGRAVDLACRLADSPVGRRLLDAEEADLVLVASESLYEDVVRGGGKFIEPARYSPALLTLKEGAVTAWFQLPGRAAPVIPDGDPRPVPDPAAQNGRSGGGKPGPGGGDAAAHPGPDTDTTDDADDDAGARYTVHGDMSQHRDNTYWQPVHIGRTTGDTGRRKG